MKKIYILLCLFLLLLPSFVMAEKTKIEKENEYLAEVAKQKRSIYHEEINRRDRLFKKIGYAGYVDGGIPSFIFRTRREGLTKHLKYVVGCVSPHPEYEGCYADPEYMRTRIISITNNGLLYQYSSGAYYFTFFVTSKKDGELYQDGQTLEKGDYVLVGTYSYQTVMGNKAIVPAFKKIQYK